MKNLSVMPVIQLNPLLSLLTINEIEMVKKIIFGKRLKASKPKVSFIKQGYIRIDNSEEAKAAYLWAYCAYFISPYKAHAGCLPSDRNIEEPERLRAIGNLICQQIPPEKWFGRINRGEI